MTVREGPESAGMKDRPEKDTNHRKKERSKRAAVGGEEVMGVRVSRRGQEVQGGSVEGGGGGLGGIGSSGAAGFFFFPGYK